MIRLAVDQTKETREITMWNSDHGIEQGQIAFEDGLSSLLVCLLN